MKKVWIAITAVVIIAGIALMFSGSEPAATLPAQEEVSSPGDRIGSGIR
tara:strand:- start:414 stop:560 length:147 start_codon:yes stop_codon:yes gene_type:complete